MSSFGTVKIFIYDSLSRSIPWSYTAGPAVQYCLSIVASALVSSPVLALVVSALLGNEALSSSAGRKKHMESTIRDILTTSLITLKLEQTSQFAKTEPLAPGPTSSTSQDIPIIITLDRDFVFMVETANDPFLCLTLITTLLHEMNHWVRFRLQRGLNAALRECAEACTKEEFGKRLFGFERGFLGGVSCLFSDKKCLYHYVDGFALERRGDANDTGTTDNTDDGGKEDGEVRIIESRENVVWALTHLREGISSLPLFDWETLRRIPMAYLDANITSHSNLNGGNNHKGNDEPELELKYEDPDLYEELDRSWQFRALKTGSSDTLEYSLSDGETGAVTATSSSGGSDSGCSASSTGSWGVLSGCDSEHESYYVERGGAANVRRAWEGIDTLGMQ